MSELVLLKFGGSLITDKAQPYTPRPNKLADLALQVKNRRQTSSNLQLILGHGSGSFGHTAGEKYKTRQGMPPRITPGEGQNYWRGFSEVWYRASELNRYVLQALVEAGIPVMTFSPAASVLAENGKIIEWDLSQIRHALAQGILPVVHGDVIFDRVKGGTILSTEDLFVHLAGELRPGRILLAGLEEGVWADFPTRKHKVRKVTRESFNGLLESAGKSSETDVTGGMESKVRQMLELAEEIPGLRIQIFSGERTKNIEKALAGEHLGTIIEL